MRFLTYSHDSCGLGHLRRTFMISRCLAERVPGSTVLSVVGSTYAENYFQPSSLNHDYIKLPCVMKVGADRYQPRHLGIGYDDLIDLRRSLLMQAVETYQPDAVIVDKNPRGLGDEMVPALESLRRSNPAAHIALGLRDVLDDPEISTPEWRDPELIGWIDRIYDSIWIWGEPDVYDAVHRYRFTPEMERRSRFLGYLPPEPRKFSGGHLRARAGVESPDERLLLMAAGGGGDAFPIFEQALRGFIESGQPSIRAFLIAGPMMSERDLEKLRVIARPLGGQIRIEKFVPHFEDWIRASDAVICMGGYNTLREVAAIGRPALVLPRMSPRREQWVRAREFAARGWCECVRPDDNAHREVENFCRRLGAGRLEHTRHNFECRAFENLLEEVGAIRERLRRAETRAVG